MEVSARIENLRAELETAALRYAMTGEFGDLRVASKRLLAYHEAQADACPEFELIELSTKMPTNKIRPNPIPRVGSVA